MIDRISRREALFVGPLILASARSVFAQGAVFDADIAIIGSGAAGLAAAHEARRLGKSVIVIEARGRVGGRIFTDHSLGIPYDAGAFYLHWATKNPWSQVAKQVGIRTVDGSVLGGPSRSTDDGTPKAASDALALYTAFERKHLDVNIRPVADISLLEAIGGTNSQLAEGVSLTSRLELGEDPRRVSALDYARLRSGYDRLAPDGFGTILERFSRGIDIRLNSPVRQINWSRHGVGIETNSGTLRVGKVIVTVSVGVLQSEAIKFKPTLPAISRDGLAGLAMGALTRASLKFNGLRFGLKPGSEAKLRLSRDRSFSFDCFNFDRDIVTAYFGGDHARSIIALSERDSIAHLLDAFSSIVGNDARSAFVAGRLNNWWTDPYSRGSFSLALPGKAAARAALAQPVGDRIFFAGEAMGCAEAGSEKLDCAITAGGAFLSGVTAARRAANR